jgi:hypothetical protein
MKNFYLSLIPVGDWCNWKDTLYHIAMTTTLHEKAYTCWRYFETLEYIKYMDDEPIFFPNEAITLEDDIKFRIVIAAPIYSYDNEKNKRMVLTPWFDEDMLYRDASWFGVDKIINNHAEYVLIVNGGYSKENDDNIQKVIDICNKANRKYKIITNHDRLKYEDAYNYFLDENK